MKSGMRPKGDEIMEPVVLFTYRDLARFKRRHWQSHVEGRARLQWNYEQGYWQLFGPQGETYMPGDVDLETVNQTWDRFVAIANGQA